MLNAKDNMRKNGPVCKVCGTQLFSDSVFCEQCGAPVNRKEKLDDNLCFDVFSSSDWENRWAEICGSRKNRKTGIIITNTRNCPDADSFLEVLNDYIFWVSKNCNVDYYLFDLRTQCVSDNYDQVIDALRIIRDAGKADYHLIVGDEQTIEPFVFDNYCADNDDEVVSDLPYMTLDSSNPFDGIEGINVDSFIQTGRIPAFSGDNFDLAVEYMINRMGIENESANKEFGLSAEVWKSESKHVFSEFSSETLLESPPVDLDSKKLEDTISPDARLLYFNLHGSNQTEYWYGQIGYSYPKAAEPYSFDNMIPGYFIGVEACYGAAFAERDEDSSILKRVLKNGCLAFLGSSAIAYGTSEEPGSAADIIVGSFLKSVSSGKTAGDAYIAGITDLLMQEVEDVEIKTLLEFALYGDPSTTVIQSKPRSGWSLDVPNLQINIPDIVSVSKTTFAKVDEKVQKTINDYVYAKYSLFSNAKPSTYTTSKGDYQSIFKKRIGGFDNFLKIYYDKNGIVRKECHSK